MEFVIVVVAALFAIGSTLAIGSMISQLILRTFDVLGGKSVEERVGEELHRLMVLSHFQEMRDAALAGDEERLQVLEDGLADLDIGAWASYRSELHEASEAGASK